MRNYIFIAVLLLGLGSSIVEAAPSKLACQYTETDTGQAHSDTYVFDPEKLTLNGVQNGKCESYLCVFISDTEIKLIFTNEPAWVAKYGETIDAINRISGKYQSVIKRRGVEEIVRSGHCEPLRQAF